MNNNSEERLTTIELSLIVLQPFEDYQKGQEIFDKAEIKKILLNHNAHLVAKSTYQKHVNLPTSEFESLNEKDKTAKKETKQDKTLIKKSSK